ncbi:GNAT family N-acetyltransferase [Agromyces atrinae]|uniref:Ribosomal protein S18 acetylase RimI-like enzyme n=1 Tax=Agromyces atrinae TaxID=592376 RepID=A0A852SJH4_9MICO|nr:GNAT family N-acetyltransferase [Agromyces atrinae]NYD67309.1 ribosomal protein S18 acetylase RimI-like enzyme [Agromyces atrinae]
MTSPVLIREAQPSEYDAVGRLTEEGFATGPYGHLPVSEERRRLVTDVAARAASGVVLVAESDSALVGTVTVVRAGTPQARLATGDEAELRLLAVSPAARGLGLGRALANAAQEVALEWGAPAIVLDTGSLNLTAQSLYDSLGYERLRSHADPDGRITHVDYRLPLAARDDVVVRLVRPDEYEAVADLSERAYTIEYEISDDYLASIRDIESRAIEHQVWVAADAASGALLGTVATPRRGNTISPLAQDGELDFRLLAVDPVARGRGIGDILTRHTIEIARLRGLERVVMNSGPQMVGAHRLYEKVGFGRLSERERIIEVGGRSFLLLAFTIDVPVRLRLDEKIAG